MGPDHSTEWSALDAQMRRYSPQLRDGLRIDVVASNQLASAIAQECAALRPEAFAEIRQQDAVGLKSRLEELITFQAFMDLARSIPPHPAVVRTQVITQNYVCFVYLGESCFKVLQKHALPESTIRKCCRFLTDNPVRAFRNSLAHANWRYNDDFSVSDFGRGREAIRKNR